MCYIDPSARTGFREPKIGFTHIVQIKHGVLVFANVRFVRFDRVLGATTDAFIYEIRNRCRSIARRVGPPISPHEHRRRRVRTVVNGYNNRFSAKLLKTNGDGRR